MSKSKLVRSCMFVVLAALSCCFVRDSQAQTNQPSNWILNQVKKRLDKNQNGVIEKEEVTGPMLENFDRFDTNSNGKIDQNELAAVVKLLAANRGNQKQRARQKIKVPDSLIRETDIAYREGDSKNWKLDIVYPKAKPDSPLPAIVFVHGGGWSSGDKGQGLFGTLPVTYAEKGYVCISVNYRLVQEAPFPACISDCKNAVRWLRANADKYHVDKKRIGAFGNSAGAHLVAMLGLAGPETKLEGDGPHQDFSSAVQSVCSSAPPTNFPKWNGKEFDISKAGPGLSRLFGKSEVEKMLEVAVQASPITHVKPGAVPFLIVHGTADKTVPVFQADSFVEALKEAKVDVTYMRFKGSGHGAFNQNKKETYPALEKFFARTLKAKE